MDSIIKFFIAIGGAVASFLFGGWTQLMTVLVVFIVIDFVSGLALAGKEGKASSRELWFGVTRKIGTLSIVAVAHLLDTVIGDDHLIRDAAIFFYLAGELLSLIENTGRLGVPIPPIISKAVQVLRGKSGDTDESR
ncbi:MAG: phage holin family protein [Candidatus Pristimantibacillus lignocellulolyticus]|uniref:Phage holin family protein n=1 Tax=Candidatus Pristimantibacillus lignocellulolyticus TaxID=2994561 RepID=A0A9J6ZER5_9BACL|nr:MAG: phage holin family protein [Candidatus Pristimantibacillus lignocellulolyticus]